MKWEPFEFQHEMLAWAQARNEFAFFVEMGLGKSVVTLKWISDLICSGEAKGALIISPLRVTTCSWPRQIAQWDFCKWMTVAHMRTPEGVARWESGDFDIALVNPEQLPTITSNRACTRCKRLEALGEACGQCDDGFVENVAHGFVDKFIKGRKELPVDILVLDELSTYKNPASVRSKALRPWIHDSPPGASKPFKSHFRFRAGLTGTPVANSYLDLFAQVRMIDGGKRLGQSFHSYRQTFFDQSDYSGYKFKLKPGAKERIDAKIADLALVMLSTDYMDIPPVIVEDVMVELPPKARKAYKDLEKELLARLDTGEIEALSMAALCVKVQQVCAGVAYDAEREVHVIHDAKVKALQGILKKHKGEPVFVATMFKHERAMLLKAIPQARLFDEKHMDDWVAGKIPVWIADFRSVSHGLDQLQAHHVAVWTSQTYSAEGYQQFNARFARTGQKETTRIYRILAKDSLDEAICEAQRFKDDEQRGLLNAIKNLQLLRTT